MNLSACFRTHMFKRSVPEKTKAAKRRDISGVRVMVRVTAADAEIDYIVTTLNV